MIFSYVLAQPNGLRYALLIFPILVFAPSISVCATMFIGVGGVVAIASELEQWISTLLSDVSSIRTMASRRRSYKTDPVKYLNNAPIAID